MNVYSILQANFLIFFSLNKEKNIYINNNPFKL